MENNQRGNQIKIVCGLEMGINTRNEKSFRKSSISVAILMLATTMTLIQMPKSFAVSPQIFHGTAQLHREEHIITPPTLRITQRFAGDPTTTAGAARRLLDGGEVRVAILHGEPVRYTLIGNRSIFQGDILLDTGCRHGRCPHAVNIAGEHQME